jgi:hypothetical protein
MAEFLEFLRRPMVQRQSKSMIILLNALLKKMLVIEGVKEQDDIFRGEHTDKRKRVIAQLNQIEEVVHATALLKKARPFFQNNNLVGYLTYF